MRPTVLLCCIFGMLAASAQNTPTEPIVIPPSPSAMAFQKYGDIGVSYHSGLPQISVPLYTAKIGDISLPISLSYHASGIKVTEEASKVGLGWTLNVSGMISRSITGGDDFRYGDRWPYHNSQLPDLPQGPLYDPNVPIAIQSGCTVNLFGNVSDLEYHDSEPDRYYYNLPDGRSGQFILGRNFVPVLEKDEKLDIQVSGPQGDSWTIRTADGYTYDFSQLEFYYGNELINEIGQHRTAWYLTGITSPTGRTVRFSYKTSTNYVKTIGAYTESRSDNAFGYMIGLGTYGDCATQPWSRDSAPGREYSNVLLDSIIFKRGCIKLRYSGREDLWNDQKLDAIDIFVKTSDDPIGYQPIKTIELVYEYFECATDRDYTIGNADVETKRLKLKRVVDKSTAGVQYDYKFDYVDEYNGNLPAKTSFARDHWGYYNARTGNTSLIPSHNLVDSEDPVLFYVGVMGDERDPNPESMDIFSLKRIWYPTGGYTEFDMEAHDFDAERSFQRDLSHFNYNPNADYRALNFMYHSDDFGQPSPASFQDAVLNGKVLDLSNAYLPPGSTTLPVTMNAFFAFNIPQEGCNFSSDPVTFRLVSEDGEASAPANIFELLNSQTPPSASCAYQGNPNTVGIIFENAYHLQNKKYYWELNVPEGSTLFSNVGVTFSFYEQETGTATGGGLRVKRIKHYDSDIDPTPEITRFDYHYLADADFDGEEESHSFGLRMVNPSYSHFSNSRQEEVVTVNGTTYHYEILCETLNRTNESTVTLAGSVTYDEVVVFYGENGENGKTVYRYHNLPDLQLNFSEETNLGELSAVVPRKAPAVGSVPHPLNGRLREQIDFRYVSNGVFDTVRHVKSEWTEEYNTSPVIWAVEKRRIKSTLSNECKKFVHYVYPVIERSWVHIKSSEETIFGQDHDQPPVTKKTEYFYENPDHFLLTRQTESGSGETTTKTLTYPLDYLASDCDAALLEMRDNLFMHSATVEQKTLLNAGGGDKVTSHEINVYGLFNSNKIAAPVVKATLLQDKAETPSNVPIYVPEAGFNTSRYRKHYNIAYDNSGQIISVSTPEGVVVTYLWGYQNTLPIAQVQNALPNQVFYTSFEDFGEGNSPDNDSKTGRTSRQGGFTKALSGLPAGAYVLTYWKKESGTWVYYEVPVNISGTTYTISLSGQVDEVRFYAEGAQMTTYIFEPMVGMLEKMDANNLVTRFEYDDFNRLRLIRDNAGDIVKLYDYYFQIK